MTESEKTRPQLPESVERGRKPRATNSESPQGGYATLDKIVDRIFAPSFLAFLLVLSLTIFALGNSQEIDRLLKILGFVTPLVSGYAGYAFGKAR